MTTGDSWSDATRVEGWAGEIRVNLVRLLAIVIFYARHLIEYFMSAPDAPIRGRYHLAVTILIVAWAFEAGLLHLWLSRRRYEAGIKYAAALWDAIMITALCAVAKDPRSPLVMIYFAFIATTPLRLSLKLIYFATAAAMLGYLVLLAYYAWYVIGFQKYYATPEVRVPRSHEVIVLLSMLVCGLLAGQVVRQARRIASG